MKNIKTLMLAALFALAACTSQTTSESSGESLDPRQAAEPLAISSEQIYKLNQPLAMAGVPAFIIPMPLTEGVSSLDASDWDCSGVSISGNLGDADSDGIPINAVYDGRCTWEYPDVSMSGYWEFDNLNIQDPSDSDPDAGIIASGGAAWSVTSSGSTLTLTWTFNKYELSKEGGNYDFTYEGSWRVTDGTNTYTFNHDLTGTWTPDDASDPWNDGVMSSVVAFNGSGPSCASWSANMQLNSAHYVDDKIINGSARFSLTDCSGDTSSGSISWSTTQVCVTVDGNTFCN